MSNGKILSLKDAAKPPTDEVDDFTNLVQEIIQTLGTEIQVHNAKLTDLNQRLKKIETMLENRGPTGVPPGIIN